jgi:hypothetical protein
MSDKKEDREKFKADVVLANWRGMLEALPHMNEKELRAALDKEVGGERRGDFIKRLHRRYNKLRSERELEEYLT